MCTSLKIHHCIYVSQVIHTYICTCNHMLIATVCVCVFIHLVTTESGVKEETVLSSKDTWS